MLFLIRIIAMDRNNLRTSVVLVGLCGLVLVFHIMSWNSSTSWSQLEADHKYITTDEVDAGLPTTHVVTERMPNIQQHEPVRISRNTIRIKTILFWTPFWGSTTWDYTTLGTLPFEHELCKHRCFATNNRTELSHADAVLYHYHDAYNGAWPQNISGRVISVLVVHEPPTIVKHKMRMFDNKVHFVMSHRRDSDIFAPYRVIRPKTNAPHTPYVPRVPLKDRPKSVVWVASNCNASSHRERYVNELAKYIDVDVYGKCGNLSCPKDQWGECMRKFESTYKFYLSFENSICKDYVTDKLYAVLRQEIVQVVMGGSDYKLQDILDPEDVINVKDFSSPNALAAYLKKLAVDEAAFNKYLEKKDRYQVLDTHGQMTLGLCRLCDRLYEQDQLKKQWKYRTDISSWWYNDTCQNDFVTEQEKHW